MKTFFGFIFNRWVFGALGLIAIGLLIWYGGPLIKIADKPPLESETARWILIGIVVFIVVVRVAWKLFSARQQNARLTEGLVSPAPTPEQPDQRRAGEQVEALRRRFEEAVTLLKQAQGAKRGLFALARRQYLYDLPWYVFIGPPGSGKTTALVNSGLNFPLSDKIGNKAVRGVGGTRNCDWWFTEEAVLLDTAGRYTTQESDRQGDSAEWSGFLKLLAKYRSRRPINGVIVAISVADVLQQTPAQLAEQAGAIRNRIQELHQLLNIRFPVYVVVTKLDLLAGFTEFFSEFGRDERAQVWGFTFPVTEKDGDALLGFGSEFDLLAQRLNDRLVSRLQGETDPQRRATLYGFPQQFERVKQSLGELLENTFAPSRFETNPMVRGVYFTSGTQEGSPIDRVMGELARSLDLGQRVLPPNRPSGKSFFLTRLFKDVVFPEQGLAGSNLRWERQRSTLEWATFAVAAIVTVASLAAWALSYWRNQQYIAEVSDKLRAVAGQVQALSPRTRPNLLDTLPTLKAVRELADTTQVVATDPPLSMRFGLYQGDKLAAASEVAYRRLLRQAFLPGLQARLEEDMRTEGQRDPDFLYEALKAYVMLSDPDHFDAKALKAFIAFDWERTLPRDVPVEQRKALEAHLDVLLSEGAPTLPNPIDQQLVARSRATVAQTPTAQRIYNRLKREDVGAAIPDFTIAKAAGPQAPLVFVRASGEPLTSGVPGLFTFDGYHKSFAATSLVATNQLASEESWVLGLSSEQRRFSSLQFLANVASEVRRLYFEEYIRTWDGLIADIRLVPIEDLQQSIQVARILSAADSPLPILMRAIVKEVTLVEPDDPIKAKVDSAISSIDKKTESLKQLFGAKGTPDTTIAKKVNPESVVDDHYTALRNLVKSAGPGQPAPIEATTALINELYTLLNAADAAVKSGNTPPASEVPNKVKAEAGHLPEPLRSMFVALARSGTTQTFGATRTNLSQALAASVGDFCSRATTDRYPFVKTSPKDVTQEDFSRLFAPGGLFDDFFQKQLASYVDTSTNPWSFRRIGDTPISESYGTLAQFARARNIRDVFFAGNQRNAGLKLEFRPLEMDATITQLILDVDGQLVKYSHGPQVPTTVQWPGPKGSTQVRLQISPPTAIGASGQVFEGPWALFRMLDGAQITPTPQAEKFIVTFNIEGRKAQFEVITSSVENPFRLAALNQFQCPDRL